MALVLALESSSFMVRRKCVRQLVIMMVKVMYDTSATR
jgi:hypothetical protein